MQEVNYIWKCQDYFIPFIPAVIDMYLHIYGVAHVERYSDFLVSICKPAQKR